jgi:tight adherence protein B
VADLLIAAAAALAALGAVQLLQRARQRSGSRGIMARLASPSSAAAPSRPARRPLLTGIARRVAGTGPGARLARLAAAAHPGRRFSDVLVLWLCGLLGGAIAGRVLLAGGPLVVLAALAGPVVADRAAARWGGRRSLRIEQQLPEALALQASALRAGHSLAQSLRRVADEVASPLGAETSRTVHEIDLGAAFDAALEGLSARAAGRAVDLWTTAMLVHRQTGGNLAAMLDSLAGRLRERARLRGEVRALTAQARLSGVVVAAAPVAFFLLLGLSSRAQMAEAFSTPVGLGALALGLAMEVAGFLWIRRILRMKL